MPDARAPAVGGLQGLAWWLGFLAVGLIAHGVLLLDDGLYADDWFVRRWMLERRFDDWQSMNLSMGYPGRAELDWAFLMFPDPLLATRVVELAVLVVSAGLLAKICLAVGLASPGQAVVIGLLSLVAPAHRALSVSSVSASVLYVMLFLAGTLWVLRAEPRSGPPRRWRRGVALGCFWASFYYPALLVPYVALCLGLVAWRWRRDGRHAVLRWLAQHWTFLALPYGFWVVRSLLLWRIRSDTPGSGRAYNAIRWWDWQGAILVYKEAFLTYAQTAWSWVRPSILLLFVAAIVAAMCVRRAFPHALDARRAGVRLALLGLALFLVGLFPYAVVGKGIGPPGAHWSGHYGALLAAPLGLLVVGVTVAMFGGLTRGARALVFTVLAAWTSDSVTTHIHWHAEAIKWKSVCRQVGRSADVRQAAIVMVLDEWPLGMHNSVEGGRVGRVIAAGRYVDVPGRHSPGFTHFFDYHCAPGTPKIGREIPPLEASLSAKAVGAAKFALGAAVRGGHLSHTANLAARRALEAGAMAGPAPLQEVLGGYRDVIFEGLRRRERDGTPAYLYWRMRSYLRLAGLPSGPAGDAHLLQEEVKTWGRILLPAALPSPAPAVLVVVRPGPGQMAVPVGDERWWQQGWRLWAAYQRARFVSEPEAAAAMLDQLAVVDILRLTQ